MSTAIEKEINQSYIDYLTDHRDICMEKAPDIKENIVRSSLFYDGEIKSKSLMIPKVYSMETFKFLENIMQITHEICNKIVRAYLDDPDYRKVFPFSKELEELILVPTGYDTLLPMSRYDIFFNEDTRDFGFCEFNTDGTSGMDENRGHDASYIDNAAHQYVLSKYDIRPFELFDTWCKEFLDIYKTYNKAKEIPRIAIVDFLGAGRFTEFKEFARRFQAMGAKCCVCDIRDFTYDGKILRTSTGFEVDAIYRRACTVDILEHMDEVKPLLSAVKDQNVFLCGAFQTQLVHSKAIFQAMHDERTHAFLTAEEINFIKKHVPKTQLFNTPDIKEKVLKDKDAYMIKPIDSYATKGIYAPGFDHSKEEWEKIVNEAFGDNYVVQDYMKQFRATNIDMAYGDGTFKQYLNMTGLYSYNGKLAGFFNRQSHENIIKTYHNERTVPTYLIYE